MVDAFGAIFNILVEAASDVIGDAKQPQCGKKVSNSYREAHSLLETARDELIVEASGVAAIEHIGPVLTPEAILIMHMERLVCGVYKNGNVDIISILEECLERLVGLQVIGVLWMKLTAILGIESQISVQSPASADDQCFRRRSRCCARCTSSTEESPRRVSRIPQTLLFRHA